MDLKEVQKQIDARWGSSAYSAEFNARPDEQRDAHHATLHITKALGKVASALDDLDHGTGINVAEVRSALADIVICAGRVASRLPRHPIDLGDAVRSRIQAKFPPNTARSEAIGADHPGLTEFERACIAVRGDNASKPDEVMLAECALGLSEEVSEVICAIEGLDAATDMAKSVVSEIGDVAWYVTTSAHRLGLTLTQLRDCETNTNLTVHGEYEDRARDMAIYAGAYAGLIKKWLHYGRPLDRDRAARYLAEILDCAEIIAKSLGHTLEGAFAANAEKNRKRFPSGGFTAAEARARIDETT